MLIYRKNDLIQLFGFLGFIAAISNDFDSLVSSAIL